MWNMLWPILMVVGANTCYNVCTKSVPDDMNPFASLIITYLVAAAGAGVMFFVTAGQATPVTEIHKINWAPFILGIAIVALEFGFISVYRAGWKISVGSAIANISLACVLLVVGIMFFKDNISVKQLIGMGVCAAGLFLIK